MQEKIEPVNLLWTGGWDSTFRLAQLILILKKKVQPYYIIDSNRKSLRQEIIAIEKITKMLFEKEATAKKLLLPIKFSLTSEIRINQNISSTYKRLKVLSSIGSQYDWLARFCFDNSISNMELCIEKEENGRAYRIIKDCIVLLNTETYSSYIVDKKFEQTDTYELFKFFSFPIIHISKSEMAEIARDYDFIEILHASWFCHNPLKNSVPCGTCNPCIDHMKSNLGFRFTLKGRLRYRFRYFYNKKLFYKKLHSFFQYHREVNPYN